MRDRILAARTSSQSYSDEGLRHRGLQLLWISQLWNVGEMGVGLWSGFQAGSVALIAFGLDSVIEVFAGVVAIRSLRREWTDGVASKTAEKRELRLLRATFFILSGYIAIQALVTLLGWVEEPRQSLVGIGLVVTTAVSMTVLHSQAYWSSPSITHREKMAQPDWVRPYLAIGPRPNDEMDWQALRKAGVTLIIDLNDSSLERQKAMELGVRHKGLRIDDPPASPESLLPLFGQVRDWIEEERKAGGKVYLHCTAGQQRSPTCAMAYLMADGETRQSAERIVKEARMGVWAGPVRIDVWKQGLELWGRELSKAKR